MKEFYKFKDNQLSKAAINCISKSIKGFRNMQSKYVKQTIHHYIKITFEKINISKYVYAYIFHYYIFEIMIKSFNDKI